PSLSPSLVKMLSDAWTLGSLDFGASQIRSGHTILALVANEELARMVRGISREIEKIRAEDLQRQIATRVAESVGESRATGVAAPSSAGEGAVRGSGQTPNLDQFSIDLAERARQGKLDPVLGRDFEVRQVVDVLTRRGQNNPILVGEAGV